MHGIQRRQIWWFGPVGLLWMFAWLTACGGSSTASAAATSGTAASTTVVATSSVPIPAKTPLVTVTAASSPTAGPCSAGNQTINGVATHQYCGPAKLQALLGGTAVAMSEGACSENAVAFTVNLGRTVAGTSGAATAVRKQYQSFTLSVAAKADGTFYGPVTINHYGATFTVASAKVVLSGAMNKGTFSGKAAEGSTISGTWTC